VTLLKSDQFRLVKSSVIPPEDHGAFACALKWTTRQLLLDSCSCTVLLHHVLWLCAVLLPHIPV